MPRRSPPRSAEKFSRNLGLWVGGCGGRRREGPRASRAGTAAGADLGGSSNYSNETLEGRRGRGFRVNGNRTRVSRSWTPHARAALGWRGIGSVFPNRRHRAGPPSATTLTRATGDVGGRPGESCRLSLTGSRRAWKRSNRREARRTGRAPPLVRRPVRSRRPLKIHWSQLVAPLHRGASGMARLVGRTHDRSRSPRWESSGRWNNVGKGSRQDGSVTSGQGLALSVAGLPPRACRSVGSGRPAGKEGGGGMNDGHRTGSD